MNNGKKGRWNGSRGGGPRASGPRRSPPAEYTGNEASFLAQLKETGQSVEVRLHTGEAHYGTIEYFDRDLIKLLRPQAPHLFIRKSDIRYLIERSASRSKPN